MKVVTAQEMAELESLAYQEGYKEHDFMENAGRGIASAVSEFIDSLDLDRRILLLCGKGNNAGDAFVAGCYLIDQGYTVDALQPIPMEQCSSLCQTNATRFLKKGGNFLNPRTEDFSSYSLLLDGIFGTGFKGAVQEPYASLIQQANQSGIPIIAIDIPSGLNGSTGESGEAVIQATQTIFLGLPKTGFFLLNGWNLVGSLYHVDFGLPAHLIEQAFAHFTLPTEQEIAHLLPVIKRSRNKYQVGQVIGLAGSPGMSGAALLSSFAALKSGCGIVRLLYPESMYNELTNSPYELIKVPYSYKQTQAVLELMQKGKATFAGPGLGRTQEVKNLLSHVIPALKNPCVLDADALTLYAEEAFKLPQKTIFTPHTGEMQRLVHQENSLIINFETLHICQQYAEEKGITLILKGAPSFIFHPGQIPSVNPTGDPGMATAGSGDVLTGLLASLLAQGLNCQEAAQLGVYLHGQAGEYAASLYTSYCMIASNIIEHFTSAYQYLQSID